MVLNNISVSFGDKAVIKDFSCHLPDSGIVAVTGPSGCGKTTLLRVISGLQRPDSGEIHGVPSKIAYVFQEHRLIPWLSALDNVLSVSDTPDPVRAQNILNQLGISGDDAKLLPAKLSGGMKQRVSIARALYYDADVYLLDEPFTGLDDDNRDNAMAILRCKADKALLILVSHNAHETADADMYIRMENDHEDH